jgi:hypothetical protein
MSRGRINRISDRWCGNILIFALPMSHLWRSKQAIRQHRRIVILHQQQRSCCLGGLTDHSNIGSAEGSDIRAMAVSEGRPERGDRGGQRERILV